MYSVCTVNKIFNIPYLRRGKNNNLKELYKNIQDYFIKLYIYWKDNEITFIRIY